MRDPYEVLGVARGVSAGAMKSAYRKLAKKHHPDANKNDPKSAARFAELNSANEISGDEDKRKQFDRGEIDADGKPRFQGFPGGDPRGRGGFETHTFRTGGAGPAALAAAAVSRTSSTACSVPRRAAHGPAEAALPSGSTPAGVRAISVSAPRSRRVWLKPQKAWGKAARCRTTTGSRPTTPAAAS